MLIAEKRTKNGKEREPALTNSRRLLHLAVCIAVEPDSIGLVIQGHGRAQRHDVDVQTGIAVLYGLFCFLQRNMVI